MLEVINGFLLVYFLVLCALSALVPFLVKPIATFFSKTSKTERASWAELHKLKEEQKEINMKDEFAAYSKLQRKINKLETELKENSSSRRNTYLAVKGSVHLIMQIVIGLVTVGSMIWFRREPVVTLKGNLFPLTTFLRYPSDLPNAVSTHVWAIMSNISIRFLIKPLSF